jgi:hypothetical protein
MLGFRRSDGVRALLAALTVALTLAALPSTSRALPLFGRKYGLQCTSCHIAAPRLNVFGMHFKQNGYRMPGAQGESPWDSTAKVFPLALVGNVSYHVASTSTDPGDGNRLRTTYAAFEQRQVEFHSAGTLGENVTFHFDNNFAGAGGPLQSGMAFVQLDDVVKDGVLNVKAGIFDADIPYLAESRNTSLSAYMNDRVTLGASGLELNGVRSSWWYALGLINSGRDSAAVSASRPGTKTFNQLENVYFWVMREAGGHMYTARVYLDHQDPRKLNALSSQRLQADLSAYVDRGRLTLIPGYTYEKYQDQPLGTSDETHTGLLEATCLLGKDSRWALTARLEHEYVPKNNGATSVQDHNLGAMNLAYYVNANARFGIDWAHGSDNIRGPVTDDVQAFVWVGY